MDQEKRPEGTERCGDKRKAPKSTKGISKEKSQKLPWGNGPPPPEWIEVTLLGVELTFR